MKRLSHRKALELPESGSKHKLKIEKAGLHAATPSSATSAFMTKNEPNNEVDDVFDDEASFQKEKNNAEMTDPKSHKLPQSMKTVQEGKIEKPSNKSVADEVRTKGVAHQVQAKGVAQSAHKKGSTRPARDIKVSRKAKTGKSFLWS